MQFMYLSLTTGSPKYSLPFGIFSPVCFELSVPVQLIDLKDLSPKLSIMCWAGHTTLLTNHSVCHFPFFLIIAICLLHSKGWRSSRARLSLSLWPAMQYLCLSGLFVFACFLADGRPSFMVSCCSNLQAMQTVPLIDWEFKFYELIYFFPNWQLFGILNYHKILKIKFAVMSFNMKLENFLDLLTFKQN